MREAREELEVIQERIHNYIEYGYASHLEPVVDALIECKNRLEAILGEGKSYYDRYRSFREEVSIKLSEVLESKVVDISGQNFEAVITERHSCESFTAKVERIASSGFESGGEEYSWREMSVSDMCVLLDFVITGEW